ncbi:hypothetical protein BH11MYX2_BH11MYX2_04610 [soil metagenome]
MLDLIVEHGVTVLDQTPSADTTLARSVICAPIPDLTLPVLDDSLQPAVVGADGSASDPVQLGL